MSADRDLSSIEYKHSTRADVAKNVVALQGRNSLTAVHEATGHRRTFIVVELGDRRDQTRIGIVGRWRRRLRHRAGRVNEPTPLAQRPTVVSTRQHEIDLFEVRFTDVGDIHPARAREVERQLVRVAKSVGPHFGKAIGRGPADEGVIRRDAITAATTVCAARVDTQNGTEQRIRSAYRTRIAAPHASAFAHEHVQHAVARHLWLHGRIETDVLHAVLGIRCLEPHHLAALAFEEVGAGLACGPLGQYEVRFDRHRDRRPQISASVAGQLCVYGIQPAGLSEIRCDRQRVEPGGQSRPIGKAGRFRRKVEIQSHAALCVDRVDLAALIDGELAHRAIAQWDEMVDSRDGGITRFGRSRGGCSGRQRRG